MDEEAPAKRRQTVRPAARRANAKVEVNIRSRVSVVTRTRAKVKANAVSMAPAKSNNKAGSVTDTTPTGSDTVSIGQPATHPSHLNVTGEVMVIGQGDVGQLGLGNEVLERKNPAPVVGLKESLMQVVCGGMHTVALSKEGKVYTWGCNDEGALGHLTSEEEEYLPGKVDKLDAIRVLQVSAGDSHTAALASDGQVYCWGVFRDSSGPFGSPCAHPQLVYTSLSDRAVKIDSGSDHLVILTEQGNVYTLGCAEQGQLGRVAECFSSRGGRKGVDHLLEPDIVRIPRKRGRPSPKFTDVFCGSYHTYGCTNSPPAIYVWGLNNYGQLGTGDTVSRYQPHVIAVQEWFGEEGDGLGDLQIAGGQHHSVLCHNGSVYVMGRKEYGRLGLGKEGEEPHLPQKVPTLSNISSVAAGVACSYAVAQTGEAYSWGMGTNLQLGNGSEEDAWTPDRVRGKNLENCRVLAVSAGGQHTAMLVRKDGN